MVFDSDSHLAEAFSVKRTPFAYLVDAGLVRSKAVVNTYKQLITLVGGHGLLQPSGWRPEETS